MGHQISSQTENSQNVDICNINNGGCEQLCISVNDSTTKCNCTKGYSINVANPKNCDQIEEMLLFADNTKLSGLVLTYPNENILSQNIKFCSITSLGFLASKAGIILQIQTKNVRNVHIHTSVNYLKNN